MRCAADEQLRLVDRLVEGRERVLRDQCELHGIAGHQAELEDCADDVLRRQCMIDQVHRRSGRDRDDAALVARVAHEEPFGGEMTDLHLVDAGAGVAFDHLHGRRRVRGVGGFEQDAAPGFGAGIVVVVQEPLRLRAIETCGEQHAVRAQPFGVVADEQARGLDRRQRDVLDDHVRDAGDREVAGSHDLGLHVELDPVVGAQVAAHRDRFGDADR